MKRIKSGNLNQEVKNSKTNGWIIGHFIEKDPFFQTDDFEMKWSTHKKGEIKKGKKAKSLAKTITILIKGKFEVRFSDINEKVSLLKLGDYLSYDASESNHVGEAIEDSILLTLRWPSKR